MNLSDYNYQKIIEIAINAGNIILDIKKQKNLSITLKEDSSPLTLADCSSNDYIMQSLREAFPDIPIISEESYCQEADINDYFFLVDPLDGTRDFIEGTDDYCVNIALIHHHSPVLGVIYLPEKKQCYYAIHNKGSFKINDCSDISLVHRLCVRPVSRQKIQTISSRSFDQSYHYFERSLDVTKTVRAGAAIKFCLIAEGLVDIYPRVGQTGEWDTAAGELIVTEAGGYVRDINHQPLFYGKTQKKFLNDAFYAANSILSEQ